MSDETTSATAVWSRQEVLTGVAALLMFYLFIGAVFWLHRVADANSEALGISTWAEKAATEAEVDLEIPCAADVSGRKCERHHRHTNPDLRGLDPTESQSKVLNGHDSLVRGHVTGKSRYLQKC